MATKHQHNRRFFIKSAVAGLTLSIIGLWDRMVLTQRKINSKKTISMPFETNKKISFQDDFIIINKEHKTKVYSSRCTHLGCKIDKTKNDQLICPCHGSTFDLDGNATKGPAVNALGEKEFEIDLLIGQITVNS